MPKFKYTAHDIKGAEKSGTINAPDQATATAQLRSKGLFPSSVMGTELKLPITGKSTKRSRGLDMEIRLPAALTVVHPKQLMVLTRQMATLIHAGLPLLRGLKVLERQEKNAALKKAVHEIAETIEGGSTFAEALALHPRIFNKLFINMVKAGEAGGLLDVVLERRVRILTRLGLFSHYPIMALAAVGLIVLRRRGETLIPLLAVIATAVIAGAASFGITRYRPIGSPSCAAANSATAWLLATIPSTSRLAARCSRTWRGRFHPASWRRLDRTTGLP